MCYVKSLKLLPHQQLARTMRKLLTDFIVTQVRQRRACQALSGPMLIHRLLFSISSGGVVGPMTTLARFSFPTVLHCQTCLIGICWLEGWSFEAVNGEGRTEKVGIDAAWARCWMVA
jgi:hypothetical protein